MVSGRQMTSIAPWGYRGAALCRCCQDAASVVGRIFDEAERRDPGTSAPGSRSSTGTTTRSIGSVPRLARARCRCASSSTSSTCWSTCGRRPGAATPKATPPPRHGCATTPWAVLDGKSTRVAGAIRRAATMAELDRAKRAGADAGATYLTNKSRYLDYPTALTKGWPIATGVIEGACRHLVKDRMDLTGAR